MRYGLEKLKNCFSIFSETVKDRDTIFSGMIDLSIGVCVTGMSMSAVTSGRHRKWKNKWKILNFLFLAECYTILLSSCFNCPNLLIPPDIQSSTSDYLEKKFSILNFHCLKSSLFL